MKKEKNNLKNYSFRKRLYNILYLLFGVTLAGLIGYSAFFSYSMQQRTYKDVRQLLSLYNEETSKDLKSVDYYLMELKNYSTEVATTATLESIDGHYSSILRISQMFEFNLRSFPSIKGMYAYFPKSNTWVGYSNTAESQKTFQPFLKNQFQNEEILGYIEDANGLKWIPYNYENKTYLVKTFMYDNSMIGAWTDLNALSSSLTSLDDMEAVIIFTDKEGNVISIESPSSVAKDMAANLAEQKDQLRLPLKKSLNGSSEITVDSKRYMVTTQELDYCDYYITAMIPMKIISQSVNTFWRYALLFMILILIVFGIVVYFFNKLVGGTMKMLTSMNNAIMSGDMDHRIDVTDERCDEVLEVATTYNSMVDHIQKLKLDVYEERIHKKNFQLFFLKSQVAPHFLINCLNMITYLADGTKENTAILRSMIETLSKHLRYTLSTSEHVPLSKELEYLDNYVELTKIRFPGCITYEKDIDEMAPSAEVFPLILIMFMENAFKFNLIMGEELIVKVSANVYLKNDEKRLHISHVDSGEGFSEEFLEQFNNDQYILITDKDGNHVGIKNVVSRLRLYYDESAVMKLSNEPGMGARIDLDIPYVEYQKPKDEKTTMKGIIS